MENTQTDGILLSKHGGNALSFARPFFDQTPSQPLLAHIWPEPEGMIWWHEIYGGHVLNQAVHPPDCLPAFIRLKDAPNEDVLRFVDSFGVLGLWPVSKELPKLGQDEFGITIELPETRTFYGDAVDLYRRMARYAWAILKIVAINNEKGQRDNAIWQVLFPNKDWPEDNEEARVDLLGAISLWTRSVPLFLQLWWKKEENYPQAKLEDAPHLQSWHEAQYRKAQEERWQFRDVHDYRTFYELWPRRSRLFTLIVTQMVAALEGPLYSCDICGDPFEVKHRRPSDDPRRKKLCGRTECRQKRQRERAKASYDNKMEGKTRQKIGRPKKT